MENQTPSVDSLLIRDAKNTFLPFTSVSTNSQNPVKKPTRQWDAWTRQEEEKFFNALRQVGKNFEKITCRVQSKNKDQVRHYYYRLVRRMNKLLGPGFCFDAKNSKDTNAAMLRWWSLLEKHSCTASKLHLKPRRFKIFIEALENQLLKDRNKTRRKRLPEDMCSPTSSTTILSKGPANDIYPVKLLAVEAPNTNKSAASKGTFHKNDMYSNMNYRRDLSSMKPLRQKRRPGDIASAEYKKWEKAAIAGVSLVADAAEELERATSNINLSYDGETYHVISNKMYTNSGICSTEMTKTIVEPSLKLKLQLFPVDEYTQNVLQKDGHNPHLELTLSARKRISSVMEHLNRKWGDSTIASHELILFPYSVKQEDLASSKRWTSKDTDVSTADVHATVGSPTVFRLRYGWFSSSEPGSEGVQSSHTALSPDNCLHSKDALHENQAGPMANLATVAVDLPGKDCTKCGDRFSDTSTQLFSGEKARDESKWKKKDAVTLEVNCLSMSAGEWADSLTNISVGDLLNEASKAANSERMNTTDGTLSTCLQLTSFSCDSFDAAIAAHISEHQFSTFSNKASQPSIWDAEETCDEFSFQKVPVETQERSKLATSTCVETGEQTSSKCPSGIQNFLKDFGTEGSRDEPHCNKSEVESCKDKSFNDRSDCEKDVSLADIYWSDSLGPLDLDMPAAKFQGQDVIFGDSLSLSRLIANSLDEFQNFSLFCSDNKDSTSRGAWER
ncbi:TSL-kinase interacting protein 1 isoform X1 [Canna indica]|uniref:TSL-kinase interacting protein 1 isoform X1 n=1 Tax=Canna indica TaxID=4628 RepID=A0AAQ3Q4M0_9LILI|nr:TSL-kinase interacting protein 1 isoform X1 [Canna indica]